MSIALSSPTIRTLAIVSIAALSCNRTPQQDPSTSSHASAPQPTQITEALPQAQPKPALRDEELERRIKLVEQVQPKLKPEYLDELIERANTKESKAITAEALKSEPGVWLGHPWMFTGQLKNMHQNGPNADPPFSRLYIAVNGDDNLRVTVEGAYHVDFVRGEYVDVVGYLAGSKIQPLYMIGHTVMKRGGIKERLRTIALMNDGH